MTTMRIFELGSFAIVAAALHVLAFGLVSRDEGSMSAGAAGDAMVSLEAADAQVADMVEQWENPQVPEPVMQLSSEPPVIQPPKIELPPSDLPMLTDAPPIPEVEKAEPEVPPEPERSALAPEATERPMARPERPAPKRQAKPEPTPEPARKSDRTSAAQAAQAASGSGNRGAAGENGQAKAATLSKAQADNLRGRWGAQIRQRIERRKRYPSAARGAQGQAVVRLTVSAAGQLVSVSLARSSGNAAIDQAAVTAVQRAGQFPAAPRGLGASSLSFSLPMSFARR
ncbi:TonB family protein [Thioclava sp. GXIMD2076]|uniref:cell envelope integrity protein TolA n=1 Tax=Thioclava sp. GXIMD2076 TaxID=3131931 RepID=UPI0030CC1210